MKVSVIVPVYNVEDYLRKCLDSLLSQTLENIEIIVVNDGSKDNSQQIIEEYQNANPHKIKSFVKENGGLSDARNFGLQYVTGDYIGFVDSDDYVSPEMFEDMLHLAQKNNADIVICNLQKINEDGVITQKITQIPNMPEKIVLKDNLSVFSDMGCFACNKLFRKELFAEKRFKKGVHFEDIQLIPQLVLESSTLAQTQAYYYQYFERSNSISKTHNLRGLDIIKAVEDVEVAFYKSTYKSDAAAIKNFQIFEGVYTYLAYLAFVKDKSTYLQMRTKLSHFMKDRKISRYDALGYSRFDKNYFSSMPLTKRVYYIIQLFVPIQFHYLLLSRLTK